MTIASNTLYAKKICFARNISWVSFIWLLFQSWYMLCIYRNSHEYFTRNAGNKYRCCHAIVHAPTSDFVTPSQKIGCVFLVRLSFSFFFSRTFSQIKAFHFYVSPWVCSNKSSRTLSERAQLSLPMHMKREESKCFCCRKGNMNHHAENYTFHPFNDGLY